MSVTFETPLPAYLSVAGRARIIHVLPARRISLTDGRGPSVSPRPVVMWRYERTFLGREALECEACSSTRRSVVSLCSTNKYVCICWLGRLSHPVCAARREMLGIVVELGGICLVNVVVFAFFKYESITRVLWTRSRSSECFFRLFTSTLLDVKIRIKTKQNMYWLTLVIGQNREYTRCTSMKCGFFSSKNTR